jgi:hypothetical protein
MGVQIKTLNQEPFVTEMLKIALKASLSIRFDPPLVIGDLPQGELFIAQESVFLTLANYIIWQTRLSFRSIIHQ